MQVIFPKLINQFSDKTGYPTCSRNVGYSTRTMIQINPHASCPLVTPLDPIQSHHHPPNHVRIQAAHDPEHGCYNSFNSAE